MYLLKSLFRYLSKFYICMPRNNTFFDIHHFLRYVISLLDVPHSILGVHGEGKTLGNNVPLNERFEIDQDLLPSSHPHTLKP